MRGFTASCLDSATSAGATYADVRVTDTRTERLSMRNGTPEGIETASSLGFGVRVVSDGAWGFASSSDLSEGSASTVARQAVAIARASALVCARGVRLADVPAFEDAWSGACDIDPFSVSLEEKLAVLEAADAAMRAQKGVSLALSSMSFLSSAKTFASTEGSFIEQRWVESSAGIVAYAIEGADVFPRSYPNSLGGGCYQAGWEAILGLDLAVHAPRIAEEAVALLEAADCPSGPATLVIGGSQLALQVHESVGHPTELDRVLGDEAAFAGTSFLRLEDLGTLRYGSDLVSVTADATIPGSLGSFGYDDEGVPAQRDFLIRDGLLSGFLTSRESAPAIGRASNGCMRADGWSKTPLVRMTTISLEPGDAGTLDDLIADTDEGLYFDTNSSWSIDDRRLNFQFACEAAWEIKGGKLGRMMRRPNYTGITPVFWGSCDAICSPSEWTVWGLDNCGKGEPMQTAHVAHGAAPARFRGVEAGVGR